MGSAKKMLSSMSISPPPPIKRQVCPPGVVSVTALVLRAKFAVMRGCRWKRIAKRPMPQVRCRCSRRWSWSWPSRVEPGLEQCQPAAVDVAEAVAIAVVADLDADIGIVLGNFVLNVAGARKPEQFAARHMS